MGQVYGPCEHLTHSMAKYLICHQCTAEKRATMPDHTTDAPLTRAELEGFSEVARLFEDDTHSNPSWEVTGRWMTTSEILARLVSEVWRGRESEADLRQIIELTHAALHRVGGAEVEHSTS